MENVIRFLSAVGLSNNLELHKATGRNRYRHNHTPQANIDTTLGKLIDSDAHACVPTGHIINIDI
jgi:hypothetical protein